METTATTLPTPPPQEPLPPPPPPPPKIPQQTGLEQLTTKFQNQLDQMQKVAAQMTEQLEALKSALVSFPVPPTPRYSGPSYQNFNESIELNDVDPQNLFNESFIRSMTQRPPSVMRPASAIPRPKSTIPRPASTVPRPVSTLPRPASTIPRPASTIPRPQVILTTQNSVTTVPEKRPKGRPRKNLVKAPVPKKSTAGRGRPRKRPDTFPPTRATPSLKSKQKLACDQCPKAFGTPWSLKEHQKLHQGLTRCNGCKYVYSTSYSLRRHHQANNSCGKPTATATTTPPGEKRPAPSTPRPPLKRLCPTPSEETRPPSTTSQRERTLPMIKKMFTCGECGDVYDTEDKLNDHVCQEDEIFIID